MTRQERTGWRDEEISRRHRLWGTSCPAVDIDWLLLEFGTGGDYFEPAALIEYKHERARPVDMRSPTISALRRLADAYPIPCMVVVYRKHPAWSFTVRPANEEAENIYGWMDGFDGETNSILLSERDYVASLYQIRGRPVPTGLFDRIDSQ